MAEITELQKQAIQATADFWYSGRLRPDWRWLINAVHKEWPDGIAVSGYLREAMTKIQSSGRAAYAISNRRELEAYLTRKVTAIIAEPGDPRADVSVEAPDLAAKVDLPQSNSETPDNARQDTRAERTQRYHEDAVARVAAVRAKVLEEFEALGQAMQSTQSRDELVQLVRRRVELAPQTRMSFIYENYCWACKGRISSMIHARCAVCNWYICSCGACVRGSFGH